MAKLEIRNQQVSPLQSRHFYFNTKEGQKQGDNKVTINYADKDNKSGIKEVIIGDYHIDIEFKNGGIYRYSQESVGKTNLAIMKTLAIAGRGLNRFLNKYVRNRYQNRFGFQPSSAYRQPPTTINTDEAIRILTELLDGAKISLVVN